MMTEVPVILSLFFYGLVAFTPDEFQCDGNMRALLIDARRPPVASDGCPIHSHTPALFYFVTQAGSCRHPCRIDRGLCRCDLDGGQLLDIGRSETDLCYERQGCMPDPTSSGSCPDQDFDFIPKLRRLRPMRSRMDLRCDCNKPCPVQSDYCTEGMCKLIAAQINFHPRDFSICRMAGELDDRSGKCPKFEFKPLTSTNLWWPRDRHIAEIVRFETTILAEDPHLVKLTIAAFDGGGKYTIDVPVVEYGGKHYTELVIANFMDEDHGSAYARCDRNYVARDFELYHDLTSRPMQPPDRTIPRAEEGAERVPFSPRGGYRSCVNSKTLTAFRVDVLRAGDTRQICPQAAMGQ